MTLPGMRLGIIFGYDILCHTLAFSNCWHGDVTEPPPSPSSSESEESLKCRISISGQAMQSTQGACYFKG